MELASLCLAKKNYSTNLFRAELLVVSLILMIYIQSSLRNLTFKADFKVELTMKLKFDLIIKVNLDLSQIFRIDLKLKYQTRS